MEVAFFGTCKNRPMKTEEFSLGKRANPKPFSKPQMDPMSSDFERMLERNMSLETVIKFVNNIKQKKNQELLVMIRGHLMRGNRLELLAEFERWVLQSIRYEDQHRCNRRKIEDHFDASKKSMARMLSRIGC